MTVGQHRCDQLGGHRVAQVRLRPQRGHGLSGDLVPIGEELAQFGLEALGEALSAEVASLGLKVTIVEPGPYGTDWSGDSAVHTEPIAAYQPVRDARRAGDAARAPADPAVTAQVMLKLVDAEDPPLRLFIGPYPYAVAEKVYQERLSAWQEWRGPAELAAPGAQEVS